ncbi:L-seryl-tRNA(Sec) selenium transferase [Pontibacillus marinus]|uniref:L-seryl-tRNA(Sec) selenium transferase n=1 Tax=Pontibacillus marinus BH030004 = DSM 16465 TaxID=1385511 RepID=A0A0A5FYD0_9BACI|nr:L-seryl-tRNA(Sec) selenium transferase [Pontibacillus marinus]KGX83833.1 selenocysteine synthase [Pontibacillus marinus BH030004 = DSM 16465]
MQEFLRNIPPIHELQNHKKVRQIQSDFNVNKDQLTSFLQQETQNVRKDILSGLWEPAKESEIEKEILSRVYKNVKDWITPNLKRVINATGTILHTNLGRARLSHEAMKRVVEVASHYSNLEYNIEQGKRGSRHDIVEDLIKELTGAEAAMVVNNNAAAVYIILRAFANDQNVIVSRGELVEIGGSFRVSSIMEESGAGLVEVGTTNKTHLYDYKNAIDDETAMLMKVHTSNFKILGFTESVDRRSLVKLTQETDKLYYEDLGSGAFYPFQDEGIGEEPVVRKILNEGADLVSFSGDKLLGGPQAGIIAGKKAYIEQLKQHQLARVLRVDKMTLAALEGTFKQYVKREENQIPVIRDLRKSLVEIQEQAQKFIEHVGELKHFKLRVTDAEAQVGGGTMPEVKIPSAGVAITEESVSAEKIEQKLRQHEPSVVTRYHNEQLFFDFRTLTEEEQSELVYIIKSIDQQL